jgi:23S rRNA (guanosine2251-2'-O)-methyltransferase
MAKEIHVICDNIRSLYNVGSIFRTSDSLGISKIWLCGITGTPEQKGVQKVALGAEQSVPWKQAKSAWRVVEKLKKGGFKIVALELTKDSKNIKMFKPEYPLALVVGNEVDGVSPALLKRCDAVIHIPMRGIKESMNVSVAYGIAAYELTK